MDDSVDRYHPGHVPSLNPTRHPHLQRSIILAKKNGRCPKMISRTASTWEERSTTYADWNCEERDRAGRPARPISSTTSLRSPPHAHLGDEQDQRDQRHANARDATRSARRENNRDTYTQSRKATKPNSQAQRHWKRMGKIKDLKGTNGILATPRGSARRQRPQTHTRTQKRHKPRTRAQRHRKEWARSKTSRARTAQSTPRRERTRTGTQTHTQTDTDRDTDTQARADTTHKKATQRHAYSPASPRSLLCLVLRPRRPSGFCWGAATGAVLTFVPCELADPAGSQDILEIYKEEVNILEI